MELLVDKLAGNRALCRLFSKYFAGESVGSNISITFSLCRVIYKSVTSSILKKYYAGYLQSNNICCCMELV